MFLPCVGLTPSHTPASTRTDTSAFSVPRALHYVMCPCVIVIVSVSVSVSVVCLTVLDDM